MLEPEIDLLAVERGRITAPAGCGKTQLIANALARHMGPKPILVLMHTNAGVGALRARLDTAGVPHARYRLATLDGFAIRLIRTFLGNYYQGDKVTARAADDDLGVGNLHSRLCIMCQAGWGQGGVGRHLRASGARMSRSATRAQGSSKTFEHLHEILLEPRAAEPPSRPSSTPGRSDR